MISTRTPIHLGPFRFLVWFLLLLTLLVTAGPFFWMISTSFKLPADQYDGAILPVRWTMENFSRLFQSTPFMGQQLGNSFEISLLVLIGQVLTCSAAGFVFAVFRFKGRNLVFGLLLASMVIPPQVTLIPNFIMFSSVGLIGTKIPLWITAFMGGAFGTILLRQYFATIPIEMAEAARMDGASVPFMFLRIYLPMGKPALSALAILTFTTSWNDLIKPLIYLPSDQAKTTLTVALSLYQVQFNGQWTFLMACALVSIMPILIIFVIAQRQIIEGAALTGIK